VIDEIMAEVVMKIFVRTISKADKARATTIFQRLNESVRQLVRKSLLS